MTQPWTLIRGIRAGRPARLGQWPVLAAGLLALTGGLAGCRSGAITAQDNRVLHGETLHGRVMPGAAPQAFSFEGVESSLLDFTLQADVGNESAPRVEILDPEGQSLDVAGARTTTPGSATMRVVGLVLPKTGTYKVIARPAASGTPVFYRFEHRVRYAPMPDTKAMLTAGRPRPVYVSAPRGGLIAFSIKPASNDLVPDIQGVKDPWGGPALDASQVPQGANPPRVSHAHDGTMILTFVAPRPGVYTILAAAKPGSAGVGTLHVEVRRPRWATRTVYHGGSEPGVFGLPGAAADAATQTTATAPLPRAPLAPPYAPPQPAPAGSSRMPPAPPLDPPIAAR